MVDPAASAVLKGPTPNYCPVPSAYCPLPVLPKLTYPFELDRVVSGRAGGYPLIG
ncbi:hypothetical protein BH20CHL4_BH20CHL4_15160 [soil metagenome]